MLIVRPCSFVGALLGSLGFAASLSEPFAQSSSPPQTNIPPTVTLTWPRRDTGYTAGSSILLTATCTDPDGLVQAVNFMSGSNLLATVPNGPYSVTLTNLAVGLYSISAVGIDDVGARSTSQVVQIDVMLPAPQMTNSIQLQHGAAGIALDAQDNLYVICQRGNTVYGLTESFETNWLFQTDTPVVAAPVISASGQIYVILDTHVSTKRLLCLGLDGRSNWVADVTGHLSSRPGVSLDGNIYLETDDTVLHCLRQDGVEAWTNGVAEGFPSPPYASPSIGPGGTIYCTDQTSLRAVTPQGETQWQLDLGRLFASPVIGTQGEIYLGSRDGVAYRISAHGAVEWQTLLTEPNGSPPTIIAPAFFGYAACVGPDDKLYLLSSYGFTHCLNARTGERRWYCVTGAGGGNTQPVGEMLIDQAGVLYIPNYGQLGFLDGFGYIMGGFFRSTDANDYTTSPAPVLSSRGTLYYGGGNGVLYALSGAHPLANGPWPMAGHDPSRSGRAPQRRLTLQKTEAGGVVSMAWDLERPEAFKIESSLDLKTWQDVSLVMSTNRGNVSISSSIADKQFFRMKFPDP